MLVGAAQTQFIDVEHARVIETPLNDVDGVDDCSLGWRLARFDRGLLARDKVQRALLVAQVHGPIEEGHYGASVVANEQMELRAAYRARR